MRHPDTGGVGVVPGSSLEHYRLRGWLRVSDPLGADDRDQVRPADYADAPDLDAPEPDPEPSAKAPAKPSKEK
jgi:hypothetical protein